MADAVPAAPDAAARVFGDRLPLACRYVELLGSAGVERGLVGPREVPRLWDRHLLNCAVVAELLAPDQTVIDVGTGAGLPGIVLAVARPDVRVTLVEPLARRVAFLEEAVERLGLAGVEVRRGRAEDLAGRLSAPVVTARAVAPLDRLVRWTMPLVEPGGRLLAIKGARAWEELATHGAVVRSAGGDRTQVLQAGVGIVDPPTTVVEIVRGRRRKR